MPAPAVVINAETLNPQPTQQAVPSTANTLFLVSSRGEFASSGLCLDADLVMSECRASAHIEFIFAAAFSQASQSDSGLLPRYLPAFTSFANPERHYQSQKPVRLLHHQDQNACTHVIG